MKLISYVRKATTAAEKPGCEEYGALTPDAKGFVTLNACPALAGLAPYEQLRRVLVASPEEREGLAHNVSASPEPLASVRLLPPAPRCPLYLLMHGNSPTIWKRQSQRDRRWKMTRIPYLRVRPWTSLSGEGDEISATGTGRFSHGCEFGVVIGRAARRVAEGDAMDHVAGYLCQNDGALSGQHEAYAVPDAHAMTPFQRQALDTLRKAADGCGMIGPWITTREEVADPYDLIMKTYNDGQLQNRAWSGSYLQVIEFLIAYLSRFMTLPTGSLLGLGAAGWDGCPGQLPVETGAARRLTVEIEGLGALNTTIRRSEAPTESPALNRRRTAGLAPVRPPEVRAALWVARGAHGTCKAAEGIPAHSGLSPLLHPSEALAGNDQPRVLPPHATDIHVSAQLAAVIGPAPVYRVSRQEAMQRVVGVAPMIGVRDASLAEPIRNPTAYELRGAWFLGCSGDGFFRVGTPAAVGEAGSVAEAVVKVQAPGVGEASFDFSGYRFTLAEMIEMVSRTTTLMPGDILSLGQAGASLLLPRDQNAPERLRATIGDEVVLEVSVVDERDPEARDTELR